MPGLEGEKSCALVTGCSSGLGLAMVRLLLGRGFQVWGVSRGKPEIETSSQFHWHPCDLTDPAGLEPVLEAVGRESGGIDLLINNAGFAHVGTLSERAVREIEESMRVMLLVPILTTRFFLNGGGWPDGAPPSVIVNTSSLAAELPIPLMAVYNSTKAGLSGFTESMTLDRDAYPQTRFIDFRPGDYRTPFVKTFAVGDAGPEREAYVKRLEEHHARAPGPDRAAGDLWRAIERGKEGTIRSGTFFQAMIAPLGIRLFPSAWMRATIRRYYGL